MSKQVRIGRTDLYVNPIGLGTNAVGGHNLYPNLDEEQGKDFVRTAIDQGINFIDTAFIYGPKRSEELVGSVVKETGKRQDLIIATKGAHKFVDNEVVFDNSPQFLKQTVEESLKRLQLDYIDLFYIHFPDENTPEYEAVGALKKLKDEGKIRAIGVSNFNIDQLKEANKDGYVEVYQGTYNLINREAEQAILPYAVDYQISFVPSYPLASGLLAGKYTQETVFDDFRKKMPHLQGEEFQLNLKKVEQMRKIAEIKGADVSHVALSWLLAQEALDVIIPGAKNSNQVLHNLKTNNVKLTREEIAKIDKLFS